MARDPYCSNCGYSFVGLTESSKCPECGLPLVEVLVREDPARRMSVRRRSDASLLGLPLVDVALGPYGDEPFGRARGFIAIGDVATGYIAIGGRAQGFVAMGGAAIGVFAMGGLGVGLVSLSGLSLGLVFAFGGLAVGLMSYGGVSVGLLASGGVAVGYGAMGGLAVGRYAAGGTAIGTFILSAIRQDPEATAFFAQAPYQFIRTMFRPGTSGWICIFVAPMLIFSLAPALVMRFALRWARRRP